MNYIKTKKSGFTLIELLTIIAILAIIVSFATATTMNSIKKTKEKGYQTTVNNIEKMAGNYFIENTEKLFFLSNDEDDTEYQCVTVQELIDIGYFNNDIFNSEYKKDTKVKATDYVYLVRNKKTKTLIESKYLSNEDFIEKCKQAEDAEGDIAIEIENENTYSKEKNIIIKFNINNITNISNVKYQYKYVKKGVKEENVSYVDSTEQKELIVNNKGTLYTKILYNNEEITTKNKEILKIDNTPPTKPEVSNQPGENQWINTDWYLTLNTIEKESGIKYWQYTYSSNATTTGSDSNNQWVTVPNSTNTEYKTPNLAAEKSKTVDIYFRACDNVDNCSDKSDKTTLLIDKIAPAYKTGGKINCYLPFYCGKLGQATFKDNENGSGIKEIKYYVSTSSSTPEKTNPNFKTWNQIKNKFFNTCNYIYYTWTLATDNANNTTLKYTGYYYHSCETSNPEPEPEPEPVPEPEPEPEECNWLCQMIENAESWWNCGGDEECQKNYHQLNLNIASEIRYYEPPILIYYKDGPGTWHYEEDDSLVFEIDKKN